MRILFILLLLFRGAVSFAGGDWFPAGTRVRSMGGACTSVPGLWSVSNNPAAMPFLSNCTLGMQGSNAFLLKELSSGGIAVSLPFSFGCFGIDGHFTGFNLYSETRIGLAFARFFGKKLSAGVHFSGTRMALASDYGQRWVFSFDAGLALKASARLILGIHVVNPVPLKFTEYPGDRMPTLIRLGFSYAFSGKFMIAADIEKDLQHNPVIRAGTEYWIVKEFAIRLGFQSAPLKPSMGIGLRFGSLAVDIGTSYHMVLGFAPDISLSYEFTRKKD